MFKNVAAKFVVFAFDATTNVPKTGDAANITAYVSKDYGSVTVLADTSASEMDATNAPGYYLFDATQGETNADFLLVSGKSSTSNIKVIGAPAAIYPYAGAAAGASGGLLISGSNSGTTTLAALTITGATTHTGNVVLSDGLTISAPSTSNRAGITVTGNGTGAGVSVTGGNGATGNGMDLISNATNGSGFSLTGKGAGNGLLVTPGLTAHGISVNGGATSGDGINVAATLGHGLSLNAFGASKSGLICVGGSSGASHGIFASGQATGDGIHAEGGAGATGSGLHVEAKATNGNGFNIVGTGTGAGVLTTAGLTGIGLSIVGGGTSGDGVKVTTTSGHGVNLAPAGSSKHGLFSTGGNGGTSDGVNAVAGTGGVPIRGDITGNLVGTVSTLTTYTGNTPQTGDSFARIGAPAGASISADVAAINAKTTNLPAAPASTTNITAGTITTVTNLTNAPTAGDFTATMKTSIGTAVAASAVASVTGNVGGNVVGTVASVVGAVGSVTGNVGGNVAGSVASVTAGVTLAASQLFVKKNTQLTSFMFKMVLTSDHVTAATGITVAVARAIDGGAFSASTNTPATEIANGWYKITLSAGDLNGTLIAFKATGTGCDQRDILIVTQA